MHNDCRTSVLVFLLLGLASTGWMPMQDVLMNAVKSAQGRVIGAIDHRLSTSRPEAHPRLSMLKDAFLAQRCEPIEPPIALFASLLTSWRMRHGVCQ